jgi:hypothetical protein
VFSGFHLYQKFRLRCGLYAAKLATSCGYSKCTRPTMQRIVNIIRGWMISRRVWDSER